MSFENIREEELKNKIAQSYFEMFDCTQIIGNVDFCLSASQNQSPSLFLSAQTNETQSLLWAEAKKGKADILKSIVQLILTIGKARTFDKTLPPAFLGAFDAEKIAFIPYNNIQEIFYLNDFNWNVTPSNYETKEFGMVLEKVRTTIENNSLLFFFENDEQELREFIRNNFVLGKNETSKIQIDKNNFIIIYNKWLQSVKPTIAVNWDLVKKAGIIDGDFYLADLLSSENESLKDNLYILLKKDYYELDRKIDELGLFSFRKTSFLDKQRSHTQFWNKYQRPPREQYWDYILERRDLLVPQDVRERKGSFFTPQIWVELSQQYLAEVLGEDWQDEYYIWDCAAGTGNLLAGLVNRDHIWASTLDRQDVDVMKDRIQNGANLWENHVFEFDFLNDSFEKLPQNLQNVINDPEKRKKLVIYINPPYAEATDGIGLGGGKKDVSKETRMYTKYGDVLKKAKNELFAQFIVRIYKEMGGATIGQFSTLKILQSSNFAYFREFFVAKLQKMFIVPADTFDNVGGQFPIIFTIWNTQKQETFNHIVANIYGAKGQYIGEKNIYAPQKNDYINDWIKKYANQENNFIGFLAYLGNDFQNVGQVRISSIKPTSHLSTLSLNQFNLIVACVYFAVRKCITHTWLNNQDQFLYSEEKWVNDTEFQHDCLVYTLFHGKNIISSKYGTNHWIPFSEDEVGARESFDSKFMSKFIQGKLKHEGNGTLLETEKQRTTPLEFSVESKTVFEAGKELWKYYHAKINEPNFFGMMKKANVNASLYDIREYFQGRNEKGRMKSNSEDANYTQLMADLREKLQILAKKIEPKVYEYGFLRE